MSLHSAGKRRRADPDQGLGAQGSIACKRCRTRKVKCGGEHPACLGCVKADVPCIIADSTAPREYTRAEVHELEQKLGGLELALGGVQERPHNTDSNVAADPSAGSDELQSPVASTGPARYVGQDSGVSFLLSRLQSLQNAPRPSSRLPSPPSHRAPFGNVPAMEIHAPHRFPPHQVAIEAINEYFRDFHIAHPILSQSSIQASLHDSTSLLAKSSSILSIPERHSLFQLIMVLAIGSIRLYRDGFSIYHPFGFFTAALEINPPAGSCFSSLEGIENLILIARFGGYYNIGCSLWELGRLCVRISVELELHRRSPRMLYEDPASLERCRIIFWEAYLLDRFSSSTLGRPFAIDDDSITAELPEHTLKTPESTVSVFNWLVGMGRLKSKIHCAMDNRKRAAHFPSGHDPVCDSGDTISLLRRFHNELVAWRQLAPSVPLADRLCEAPEIFDLSYQEEWLHLIRAAMEKLSSNSKLPPNTLLRPCVQAACSIITSFDSLRSRNLMVFSRAYAHPIFVSSLVIVAFLNIQAYHAEGTRGESPTSVIDVDHWLGDLHDDSLDQPSLQSAWQALATCGSLMSWCSEMMPDAVVYRQFFDSLRRQIEKTRPANIPSDSGGAGDQAQASEITTRHENLEYPTIDLGEPVPIDMDFDLDEDFGTVRLEDAALFPNMAPGAFTWSFSDITGMEGIAAGMSDYVWDTAVAWQGSPTASMESRP